MKLLVLDELAAISKELPDWTLGTEAENISREFIFSDFKQAFGFMQQVAKAAETINHHPDWYNSFNKVAITLTTHSAGGLTSMDLALARAIDQLIDKP